jgi:hypothetical protein
LTVNRSGGVTLGNQSLTVNGLLDLAAGTLSVAANTLTLTGSSPIRTSGNINVSNVGSTLVFNNETAITLPSSFFSGAVNNLTISGLGGITACCDFTLNGILNLQSVNPSDTKGLLEMWDGSTAKTITMGENSSTVGFGDVTGIVRRTTLNSGVAYTFGNELTTIYFTADGTRPSEMSAKISIGTAPSWRNSGINREMEIIQTGASATKARVQYHYLDSELNENIEQNLVFWLGLSPTNVEYGRSAYNSSSNWINLSNVNVEFFSSTWDGTKKITLDEFSANTTLTWNGSESTSWTTPNNWTPVAGPSSITNIIIPDASTTPNSPILPSSTEIKTLNIEPAGVLNSVAGAQLTINGTSAWINYGGTFNPNTSTVIFNNAAATISGTTNFNNLTINNSGVLRLTANSILRIAGVLNNTEGTLRAVIDGETTTVEYNGSGNQSVVIPHSSTSRYHNLILSGSGTKTLPATALSIIADFTTSGSAIVTADAALNISGDINIGSGTTFNTANFNHVLSKNLVNNGTISATSSGTFTFNGTDSQIISGIGTTNFYNLSIDNSNPGGVLLTNSVSANSLNILSQRLLTIDTLACMNVAGSITNSAGVSGLVLKSSANAANGSLIFHNSQEAGQEVPATIEMYSKASRPTTTYKWQFFGIPLRTTSVSPTFDGAFVRKFNEAGTGSGFTADKHWIQLQAGATLTSFTGYEVTQVTPKTYYFQGNLENSDFATQRLNYTSGAQYPGQHLIGNPYTAAIDIREIVFGSQTEASVYLYNCGSKADWLNYSSAASPTETNPGQYTVATTQTAGTDIIPRQVPSMQAFLVKAMSNSADATIRIPYSSVSMKNTDKQRSPNVNKISASEKIYTRIDVVGSRYADHLWIFSDPTCTRNFDNGWDGRKLFGSALTPQLFSMEADGDYQINGVDNINNSELGFIKGEDTNYTLKFTHENSVSNYSRLYLIDFQDGSTTDITQSGTEYSFLAGSDSDPVKRFKIVTSLGVATENENLISDNVQMKIYSLQHSIHVQNSSNEIGNLYLYDPTGRFIEKIAFSANGLTTMPMSMPEGLYIAKAVTKTYQMVTNLLLRK